jgi:hypothetical protein
MLEAQGEELKYAHWCEGEDLKEPLEQELEPGGEELPLIFIKHT